MDEMQNPSDPAHQFDSKPDLNLGIELQDDLEGDTLREECGVFGIYGHPEAAAITALGLHALQHIWVERDGYPFLLAAHAGSVTRSCLPLMARSRGGTRRRSSRAPRHIVWELIPQVESAFAS